MTKTYEPGVYAKGGVEKVARTRAQAVQLVFDGFLPKSDTKAPEAKAPEADDTDLSYRELQEQAKELGIAANQSAEDLREAIDAALES